MNKEEALLIIQSIDKVLGNSVQEEELQEAQLNEAQIPTLGAFVRGHRIINEYMLLAMTVFPKETSAHKIVALFQKPLGAFVEAMDDFWSNHKILFGLLFGSMMAVDLFGTSAVVAKEQFLKILRKKIAEKYGLEDAGAPKAIDVAPTDDDDIELPEPLQEQFSRMKDLAGIDKKES